MNRAPQRDLVLIDVTMPGINGDRLAALIAEAIEPPLECWRPRPCRPPPSFATQSRRQNSWKYTTLQLGTRVALGTHGLAHANLLTLATLTQVNPRESVVSVSYRVPRWSPAWAVPEVPVPESDTHDLAIEYLRSVLLAWAEREQRNVKIARNLGLRWVKEEPRAGFDPDLCVIEPPPADEGLRSLRLWEPTHVVPWLAIEVVSPSHPYKDYIDTPDRCAACGVRELWVYDPMSAGPRRLGGPYALQIWFAEQPGSMLRCYAGSGPAQSPTLGAWLHPAVSVSPKAAKLRLTSEREASAFWPTEREAVEQRLAESERQRLQSERQHLQSERQREAGEQERAQLARRVAELEQQLKGR